MPNDPATVAPVTLINVFEMPADHVDGFVADWKIRAEFMRHQPGFRDYRLHRAVLPDARFQVINVANWDSRDALTAAISKPEFRAQTTAARDGDAQLAANPAVYNVVVQAETGAGTC